MNIAIAIMTLHLRVCKKSANCVCAAEKMYLRLLRLGWGKVSFLSPASLTESINLLDEKV